jgi:hypothetical protein
MPVHVIFDSGTVYQGTSAERARLGLKLTTAIDVTWTPSKQRLDFGGWFDSYVSLGWTRMTLREFFDYLGITENDCRKAWKQWLPR